MVNKQDIQVDSIFGNGSNYIDYYFKVVKIEEHPKFGTLVHSVVVREAEQFKPRDNARRYCDSLQDFIDFINIQNA